MTADEREQKANEHLDKALEAIAAQARALEASQLRGEKGAGPEAIAQSLPTTIFETPLMPSNTTILQSYNSAFAELDPIGGISPAKLYVDNDYTIPPVDATDVNKTHVTYNTGSHELTLSVIANGLTPGKPYRIEVYSKLVNRKYTVKLIYFTIESAGELRQVQFTEEPAPIEMINVPQAKPKIEASIAASLPTTFAPPTAVRVDEGESSS
jgi:hypothetical protein